MPRNVQRFFLSAVMLAGSYTALGQSSPTVAAQPQPADRTFKILPLPTGEFKVGRVTVHWVDHSRIEPLSPTHEYRELMVDIWYPAEPSNGVAAPYLDVQTFEKALGEAGFRRWFRDASDAILAGVTTHAVVGAPFASSAGGRDGRCPVLIFSPGEGMAREVYSAQLEDLASHGYIVAAISHPYDAMLMVLPDGRIIRYDSRRWPATPTLEGVVSFNQLQWHADDIRFVLSELIRTSESPKANLPFSRFVDPERIGAFGHSFGGMAAALACQSDTRIKACLDEDGEAAMQPFYLDPRGWGMDQAYMLLERARPSGPLSDLDVKGIGLDRPRVLELLARLEADHDTALRRTGKGSYDVVLTNQSTSHMDFSDLGILGAQSAPELQAKESFLRTVEEYTLAFFNENLRGTHEPLIDSLTPGGLVVGIRRFDPAPSPYIR
jgi:hypothetical protein